MKSSIIICFLFALVFSSCRKEDNPKLPDLIRVPLPLITLDPTGDNAISPTDPNSFAGKVIIDVYFKDDIKPQKFDIVVIKNGNPSTVKTLKEGITTFPTTLEVTGAEIIAAFGAPAEGDKFDIGADVTTISGLKVEAFPLVSNPYGSSIAGQPGSSTSVQYIVPCSFNKNNFNGEYKVISDAQWNDFAPGDKVAVAPGPGDNQISVTAYPAPAVGSNRKAMILDVNPVTTDPTAYSVTVAEQVVGDYNGAPPDATVKGVGFVNPCGDKITLTLTVNVGGDDYTDNTLILGK